MDPIEGMTNSALPHSTVADVSSANLQTAGTLSRLFQATWKPVICATVLSAAIAAYWASTYAENTYELGITLLFNRSAFGSPLYQSADVHTLAAEFSTRECLACLKDEMELPVPVELLSRRLKHSVRRGDGAVETTLKWENSEDGSRLLDRLASIGINRVRSIRDRAIDRHVLAMREAVEEKYRPEFDRLKTDYVKLSAQYGVADITDAARQLEQTIDRLEAEVRQENLSLLAADHQLARFDSFSQPTFPRYSLAPNTIRFVSHGAGAAIQEMPTPDRSVSPTTVVRRVEELETDISRERALAVAQAKLRSKEGELARLRVLASRNFVSPAELADVEAEVEVLRIEVHGNSTTQQLEEELDYLNDAVREYGDELNASEETLRSISQEKLRTEQQLAASTAKMRRLQEILTAEELKLADLELGLPRGRSLLKLMDVQEQRIETNLALADGLENLKESDAHTFSVLGKAEPTMDHVSSNARKLFAAVFLLSAVTLSFPFLVLGLQRALPSAGELLAAQIGAPVLCQMPARSRDRTSHQSEFSASSRLLAARLEKAAAGKHQLVHFVGLTGRQPSIQLVTDLQNCMTDQGIRTSVAIAGRLNPPGVQLPISGEDAQQSHIAILDGSPEEMESKLQALRAEADIVLATGFDPDEERTEIELFSLHADAVVFCAGTGKTIAENNKQLAVRIANHAATVIGVVA